LPGQRERDEMVAHTRTVCESKQLHGNVEGEAENGGGRREKERSRNKTSLSYSRGPSEAVPEAQQTKSRNRRQFKKGAISSGEKGIRTYLKKGKGKRVWTGEEK